MYAIIVAVDTTEGNSLVKEPTIDFRWNLVCWCFHATDADKYGYYGDFWWSLWATNKCDYFPMSSTFFDCLFIYMYVPEKIASNTLHY